MVRGTLKVLLVGAKGLEDTDLLSKMDPYAILLYCSQEQRSSIASGAASDPAWNKIFAFTVSDSDNVSELTVKIMDKDTLTADDFVGEATIPLEPLLAEGSLPPTVYNVVKDQEYRGEIKVGLTFTPEENVAKDTMKMFMADGENPTEATRRSLLNPFSATRNECTGMVI